MILKSKTFTSVFQFSTDQAETEDTPACDCDAGTGQKTSLGLNTKSLTFEETVVANESKVELQKSAISETHREQPSNI